MYTSIRVHICIHRDTKRFYIHTLFSLDIRFFVFERSLCGNIKIRESDLLEPCVNSQFTIIMLLLVFFFYFRLHCALL